MNHHVTPTRSCETPPSDDVAARQRVVVITERDGR